MIFFVKKYQLKVFLYQIFIYLYFILNKLIFYVKAFLLKNKFLTKS